MAKKLLPLGDNLAANQVATAFADYVDTVVLVAATPQVYTIPAGYRYCIITPSADMYMRPNAAGAAPVAKTDGTGQIPIPASIGRIFALTGAAGATEATLGMYSTPGATVQIEWFV